MSRAIIALIMLAGAVTATAAGPVTFLDESFAYDAAHPGAGYWVGNVTLNRNGETWAALALGAADGKAPSAIITVVGAMAIDVACTDVAVDGAAVAFTMGGIPGKPRFNGTVAADGQRL